MIQFDLGRPRAGNYSQTGLNKLLLSRRTTDICYSSRHRKKVDKDRNYSQRERTIQRRLNEARAKYNRPLSKQLLTEVHRKKNRLKWAQDNKATNWEQMIFFRRDNHSSKYNKKYWYGNCHEKRRSYEPSSIRSS